MDTLQRLANLPQGRRLEVLAALTDDERRALNTAIDARGRWWRYRDDPLGFVTHALGETVWSKQAEVLQAIGAHKRVAVPASHSVSKTHTAARVAAWWIATNPPETTLVITTAPTFRQVRNVLWPHIRRLHTRHGLPGDTNLTEWRIGGELVAFGFSAADTDEAAVQGFHEANLLAIVDEAGGIGHILGNALEGVMTGGNTRLLAIGNPPTDDENSWFEQTCNDPDTVTVRVSAYDTPNLTGEDVGPCMSCPASVPPHPLSTHLVDREWVDRQIARFGEDSPFVQARVHARFVAGASDRVIPWSWIERATMVEAGEAGQVRLGVDVAADGGDEFAVARWDGATVSIIHSSSGRENSSQVHVAGEVLRMVKDELSKGAQRVRVKIDAIGIGRGTFDLLSAWVAEQGLDCVIVPVNVSERADERSEFKNRRAEMWWAGRTALQPDAQDAPLRLDVDDVTAAQLAGPRYSTDTGGRVQVEAKAAMKRRGMASPDRAEAVLLALYEPRPSAVPAVPLSMGQKNMWATL